MVKYCSIECQKLDFPDHKDDCKAFRNYEIGLLPRYVCSAFLEACLNLDERDYFANERMIEIYSNKRRDNHVFHALTKSYLFLGQDAKTLQTLEWWEQFDTRKLMRQIRIVVHIALKLNEIAKMRENPPVEAAEAFEVFRTILSESSQESHRKSVASSPVMDSIQKYVNLSFVEELQEDCISFIFNEFDYSTEVFTAFSCFNEITDETDSDEEDRIKDALKKERCFDAATIWTFGKNYFPYHPEFHQIFPKFKRTYESLEEQ